MLGESIAIPSEFFVAIGSIVSGFVAAYFGYKKVSKKSEDELQKSLMADVNAQNAELREYLSNELKAALEKHKEMVQSFEEKIKEQQEEIQLLKRDRERLQMKIFKLRLCMVKYGINIDEENIDIEDMHDDDVKGE